MKKLLLLTFVILMAAAISTVSFNAVDAGPGPQRAQLAVDAGPGPQSPIYF